MISRFAWSIQGTSLAVWVSDCMSRSRCISQVCTLIEQFAQGKCTGLKGGERQSCLCDDSEGYLDPLSMVLSCQSPHLMRILVEGDKFLASHGGEKGNGSS
ncbi:hypothetical protein PAXRUDRAFT_329498 [Paxillus rubicundulus Ve08.2h10]|uniref:Uncharacterized protein n=1 Tax=Paxillus rubicundulus Ve08.2h10 TaxID=930991 RepID=A0A0D0DX93_9AGAM|nr:hypothetical protein PAXRUDRAFT_329498 [Paxillus rubicundulus Ve08.2h10]